MRGVPLLSNLRSYEELDSLAQAYLEDRFPRSLLLLGDLSAPFQRLTEGWIARNAGEAVSGMAALFRGFSRPVLSLVSDDLEAARLVIDVARANVAEPLLLALHGGEPCATAFPPGSRQTDVWMVRETAATETLPEVVQLDNAEELLAFYNRQGLHFWAPPMLNFGHAFGIRKGGELAAAAGANFVLGRQGYAQIGSIATDVRYQGRGFATACIRAVVNSLNQSGVARCGLFTDSEDALLLTFYSKQKFRKVGWFHFIEL